MSVFDHQVEATLALLRNTPGWQKICAANPDLDDFTVNSIVSEAATFAETVLAPLNAIGDRQGCRVVDGRVITPAGFGDAYKRFCQAGWLALDVPERFGGQGLPHILQAACAASFERGCVALMMLAGSSRAATFLLAESAQANVAEEWIAKLLAGDWSATICISEPDAGSDVGRIRTRAMTEGGEWRVDGTKCWISFGDHDITDRIGHCLLARTSDEAGTRGLSLFLVPDHIDGHRNDVVVERIEEKLGLHGSPTCVLRFEKSRAILLGQEGRGLQHLFTMIERMRLVTGCQGLGVASASADVAEAYAQDRRQGGSPSARPVPISTHPDVKRQLRILRRQTEVLRAATLELAATLDLASLSTDEDDRSFHQDFAAWMLPLVKNFGAEIGFDTANRAIQVLGGAGYTREWPLEQYLRDSRVMSIYEGTTGMQALDFLTRRLWRDEGRGLAAFETLVMRDIAASQNAAANERALSALRSFQDASEQMRLLSAQTEAALFKADDYMRCGWEAVAAWLSLRLPRGDAETEHGQFEGAAAAPRMACFAN